MDAEKATVAAKFVGQLEKIKNQIVEMRDDEQDAFDNLSVRQQKSKEGKALQEEINNLDTVYLDLDDAVSVLENYTESIKCEEKEYQYVEQEQDKDGRNELVLIPNNLNETVGSDFAKNLRKNIEVMTSTFEANNLQCLNVGCRYTVENKEKAYLTILVELIPIKGRLNKEVELKINLYDEENVLFYSDFNFISSMSGFDTITITCWATNDDITKAVRGKLYITT